MSVIKPEKNQKKKGIGKAKLFIKTRVLKLGLWPVH